MATRLQALFALAVLSIGGAIAMCASPVVPTIDGLPNFYDMGGGVYRSAQITSLAQATTMRDVFHIHHVLKLNFEAEGSEDFVRQAGIDVVYLPLQPAGGQDVWDDVAGTFVEPRQDTLDVAVHLLEQATPADAWDFHCEHGQDRTGITGGELRVDRDHWSKDKAWAEMLQRGYHVELAGLDAAWLRFRNPEAATMLGVRVEAGVPRLVPMPLDGGR